MENNQDITISLQCWVPCVGSKTHAGQIQYLPVSHILFPKGSFLPYCQFNHLVKFNEYCISRDLSSFRMNTYPVVLIKSALDSHLFLLITTFNKTESVFLFFVNPVNSVAYMLLLTCILDIQVVKTQFSHHMHLFTLFNNRTLTK